MNRSRTTTTILNIPVDHLTLGEAVGRIGIMIATGQPHQIATVNPEFVMAAQQNDEFRTALQHADLCVADGIGLIYAARWLGHPLPGRVTGIGLCEALAAVAGVHGWRIFLLGAAPGVAEQAAARLAERWPSIQIVGCYAGSPQPAEAPAIIARIRAAQPHILLVAYGAPAQDVWIATHQPQLRVPVAIGVGGAFDFLAGRVPRAPRWMQQLGFEWLFRLIRQPWRWRRMLALPRFALAVLRTTQSDA